MKRLRSMKTALVHDWICGMRGGEKVLEVMTDIFPEADIYTLLYEPRRVSPAINKMNVRTSFIQHLPWAGRIYRYYLPLFPLAAKGMKLRGYDLVISISHCAAKGVTVEKGTPHICYCLTPMRYVWGMGRQYFGRKGMFIKPALLWLRRWDRKNSRKQDFYIAISRNVAGRIKRYYNRDSVIIYPPVDTDFFSPRNTKGGGYYLIVSALVPYKKIDIAVKAFNVLGFPLRVIGSGTEFKRLKKMAAKNIEFMGWRTDEEVRDNYAACRALIFPGIEDFGITVAEAQACGRPVIAYKAGGALETIDPRLPSGIFFGEQSPESLAGAVKRFEETISAFDGEKIRRNILRFSRGVFRQRMENEIQRIYDIYHSRKAV